MTRLGQWLLAAVMMGIISAGALAQKSNDKRPPKDGDTRVVAKDKDKQPPNNNNDRRGRGGDDKKKP